MTQHDVTYQDKLDELRLDISHPNSRGIVFVLLEGETDIRLFRKLFNSNQCKVENIPGGNTKVEEATEELSNIYQFIIGIRDADFIKLNNIQYSKTNMFLTDFHDIEMTLIAEQEVFSSILSEYTDIQEVNHDTIRENILKIIEDISLMKWLNENENLQFSFKKISFQHLISIPNFKIDFQQYFNNLLSKSPNAQITDLNLILAKIQVLKSKNPNPLQLCNGHDFLKALAEFLRKNGKVVNLSDDLLTGIFRIKYGKEYFSKTELYTKIKQWADYNNVDMLS
jgi:hypothetical protein